jgi:hypothetical protein
MNKVINLLSSIYLLKYTMADDTLNYIGNTLDTHNCLVSAGFSWCIDSSSCIREWETPCADNYIDCSDCLKRQQVGENIACPPECDMVHIDPLIYPPYPIHPVDPLPPVIACSDVMCMMYCENGNQVDENGCQMCECLENIEIQQPICDNLYVCPKVTELYTDKADYTTFRLSLIIKPNMNIKNIYAIYGDNGNMMYIPGAYQVDDIFGGNIGGVSKNIININPDSKYDSWLTIGLIDGDPNNIISTIGIDFSNWDENNGMQIDNGAVFLVDPKDTIMNTECIIGQLTIRNSVNVEMLINVQGKYRNDYLESWAENKIVFRLNKPGTVIMNTVPVNCNLWNDGCNTCVVNNGIINTCTRLMCFTENNPYCISYSTDISGH